MPRPPGGAVSVGGQSGFMVLNPSGHGGHFVPLSGSPVPVPVPAAPLEPVIHQSEVAAVSPSPAERRVLPRPDSGQRGH